MKTKTCTLAELKKEIVSTYGTKRTAPLHAFHHAVTNVDRNYRQYCKSDEQFSKLQSWVNDYYINCGN